MHIKEDEKAVITAERAVSDNPTNFERYVELGIAYFHADRLDEALVAFQGATEINPNAAPAYSWIGRLYYHVGPPEMAINAYQRAIALDRHNINAYYGLGILYSTQLGDYEAAHEAFQAGLAHNPTEAFLVSALGSNYARMGRFYEAITTLEQSILLQPDNAFTYSWLSIIALHQRRYEDVIAACLREIEIADTHSPRRVLGYVYDWLGRQDEAIDQLNQAVLLEPEDYEARAALARIYRTVGRHHEAQEHYSLARDMAMQDNEYGQACFEVVSGNLEQALTLLEVALTKGQVQKGWIRIDPEFAFLQDDRRFQALIENAR